MDTKWKKLNSKPNVNYGISQSDMYQMYAYSKKYHTSEIWLLYPLYSEVADLKDICFKASENETPCVNVHVFFVNLDPEHYKKCLREICTQILEPDNLIE